MDSRRVYIDNLRISSSRGIRSNWHVEEGKVKALLKFRKRGIDLLHGEERLVANFEIANIEKNIYIYILSR